MQMQWSLHFETFRTLVTLKIGRIVARGWLIDEQFVHELHMHATQFGRTKCAATKLTVGHFTTGKNICCDASRRFWHWLGQIHCGRWCILRWQRCHSNTRVNCWWHVEAWFAECWRFYWMAQQVNGKFIQTHLNFIANWTNQGTICHIYQTWTQRIDADKIRLAAQRTLQCSRRCHCHVQIHGRKRYFPLFRFYSHTKYSRRNSCSKHKITLFLLRETRLRSTRQNVNARLIECDEIFSIVWCVVGVQNMTHNAVHHFARENFPFKCKNRCDRVGALYRLKYWIAQRMRSECERKN